MTSSSTFSIRKAIENDYVDFATTLWPLLDDPNPPPSQERWEREMMPTSFVAVHDDAVNKSVVVVGYVWWYAARTCQEGHIKYIMVHKSFRRRGVATCLLQAVAHTLKERYKECRRWRLHVRPENQAAVTLYQKFGFQRCFGAAEVHMRWNSVFQLAEEEKEAKESELAVVRVSPEEETTVESAFGLVRGVFGEAREFGGRIPLQLLRRSSSKPREELLLGCGIFNPAFPGAFPFCVTRPCLAKPLLEEMYKHRDRARDDFFLLIENQEALVEMLVSAGAKVEIRLDCYSGSL